jgi:type I protein arginine methyltransferase
MYSLRHHGQMIADRVRTGGYARALEKTVRPGSVVADVGAGAGIFALLACRAGARRVFAVESADVVQVTRELAAANGFAERIEIFQDVSWRVTLPEKCDVIVADLHGVLPPFERSLGSLLDARQRWLVPGGVIIPAVETLWAAVVHAPEVYAPLVSPWSKSVYGLDLSAARTLATNHLIKTRVQPGQLLTDPQCWAQLDYATLEDWNVSGEVKWTASREGKAHGLVVWFDALLAEDILISNAPQAPEMVFGSMFFPFSEPLDLTPQDRITVQLRADFVGTDYVWSWETRVEEPSSAPAELGDPQAAGRTKAAFRQSTFLGSPVSGLRLKSLSAEYKPLLSFEGKSQLLVLSLMDSDRSNGEIANELCTRFPERYPNWKEALARVGEVARQFGRRRSESELRSQ